MFLTHVLYTRFQSSLETGVVTKLTNLFKHRYHTHVFQQEIYRFTYAGGQTKVIKKLLFIYATRGQLRYLPRLIPIVVVFVQLHCPLFVL